MLKVSVGDRRKCAFWLLLAAFSFVVLVPAARAFQMEQGGGVVQPASPLQVTQPQINSGTYRGSVTTERPVSGVLPLSLDDAIARGLKHNLGLILTSQSGLSARGQQLAQLQALLPTVDANLKAAVQQTDLQAQGLRISGFPTIIGPYGYTDIRASLKWSLLNLSALQNYLAAKHDFEGTKLSLADARDLVVLTVGNAYLSCIADKSRIETEQAQVNTAKVSLDQAVQSHKAGTSPLLDELRARVDYQAQQQALITAQNAYDKDRIALARAIGLPLEQKFNLTTEAPYEPLDHLDADAAVKEALALRSDLKAMRERVTAAEHARKAATDERLPVIGFSGDYGDIGVNPANSHGTGNAAATLDVPLFEEGKLRGDAKQAQSQLDQARARLSDLKGQISADVRDSILDIEAAQKQVEVSRSNVELAREALTESQERFKAGVADNLAVSQALSALAQANNQYVNSLYEHNLAKLSLARALGVAGNDYKTYVGGK
ncbi:MAG TPA: TolC family protein [Acidobacteriaceae bacterium]|nr:TolC family protein [Acidobacteriaceae bacterium]